MGVFKEEKPKSNDEIYDKWLNYIKKRNKEKQDEEMK